MSVFKNALEKKKAAPQYDYTAMAECNKVFGKLFVESNRFVKLARVVHKILGFLFSQVFSMISFPKLLKSRYRWKNLDDTTIPKSTMLLLNGDPLEKIDKTFNSYFNKLIDTYFEFEEVPVEAATPHLPVDHVNPLVKDKLQQENADLEAFEKMRPKTRRIHKTRPQANLKNLEDTLKKEILRWEGTLKAQKQAIIWQANCITAAKNTHKIGDVHRDAHQQKVTWQDLQDCFCRGDLESFRQKTQLNEDEISRLFQGIADYSMKKSRLDQFKHVTVAIKAYDKSTAEVKKEEEAKKDEEAKKEDEITASKASSSRWRLWPVKQASKNATGLVREKERQEREHRIEESQAKKDLYLQHVVTAMNLFPAYQKSYKKRSEMLFELANGYFYRQEQIQKHFEIMDSLNSNPEILAQMRTGYGKTKTVVPTLDIKLAEQGKLVVNVWPASLEETNTQDVKAQLEKSFARPVDAMKFDRSTEITEENLEKRYFELQKDIKEGRPLNIRPETIRALEAHLILMLNECHSKEVDASAYAKQLEYLLKIHHLIRVTTAAFIDEAKHNLDPRDKLIYTSGKPQTLPVDDVNLIEEMFKVLSEPPFSQILDIKNNNHPLVSKQVYEEKIALELVKVFEKKWKIVSDYSKDFRQFILGEMQDVPRWMTWHPKLSQMCLLRGEMLFILNTACRGYVGQQFGLSQKHFATKQFAIPYVSANTPKETERAPSECKNPHEALNKTYITYLEQGLAKDQVSKLIETLQELAFKETGVGMTFDKTPSNQFFLKICPNSKKTLNNLNKEDIQNMYTDLKHNNAAIFYYIRHVIVQQIVYYPKTITSTTQNFRSQFAKSISLSATPQDPGAHGPNTLLIPVKGTAGQVTHVLYTKCKDAQTIQQLKATTSRDLMKETQALAGKDLAMQATVDVGALYKGISNQTLAEHTCQELRESRANIEAVVFFDDRGDPQRFMVMDVMNGQIQPLDGCSIDPTKRYTIYDQHRSYGSDIPQAFSAKGLILLSKESTKSEAAQGWGRFRQGDKILEGQIKGQTPVFAIPLNVSQEIFGKKDPNITDLLVHLAANEAIANSEFNYESLKEQMDNEIRRALLDKLEGVQIGDSSKKPVPDAKKIQVDVKKALQLFAHYQKELIVEESFDPLLLYARTPKAEDTVKFLVQYQKRCIERVQKCRGLSKAEKKFIIDRLGKYSAKWSGNNNSLSLPPQVKATSSALGLACEVFAEVETQVNTSTQVESGTTEVLRTPSAWNENMDLYAVGWERPSAMRLTMLRTLTAKVTSVSRRINKAWDTMSYATKDKLITTSVGLTAVNIIYKIGLLAGVKFLTFGSPIISSVAIPILLAALPVSLIVLGSRHLIVQSKIWRNLTTTICKNYRLKEVLGKHLPKEILSAKELFSPNFLASDNFYRQNTLGILEPIQKVLDDEQKPLFQVLVIQDEHRGKKQVQFLAIDQNDSQYFRKRLQKDQDVVDDTAKVSQRTRKLAVVDVRTGKIVAQGKNGFEKDELELNPDYNSMMTQAKLLDGEILFNDAEQAQLRAAVTKVGQKCVRKFFEDYVLPLHPSNKHCYVNKPIAQILGKVA